MVAIPNVFKHAADDVRSLCRLPAGGVAGQTIFQIWNLVANMGNHHLLPFVATVTRVLRVRAAMAGLAGFNLVGAVVMIEHEGVLEQLRWRPGEGGMAASAIRPEQVSVQTGLNMAALASIGGVAILVIQMAGIAGNLLMGAV